MIHFFENAPGEEGLPYKREFLLFFGAVLRHLTHLRYLDLARCPLFSLLFFTLHYGRPQLPAEEEEQEGEERFVLDRNAVTTWCNNSHLERVTLADQQQPSLDWRHLRYVYQPTLRELSLAGSSVNTLDWLLPNFGKPPTANQSFSLYLNSCRRIRDWTPLGRLRGPWATAWIKDTECPRAVYEPMKADGVNICRE
ncbi:hypothetical protein AGDE_17157 [Angomonas deanei]|uniref:Uncharacterized protein n=1 Tax=Angomonas deanei TaxID=59799 RepID=A0A7G2C4E3_9TRYP|nr:hypothetical protein AGDE_17157 [Angomonas deanei]CAD2214586.1 hypothetical protein, conserved [Angomonas deanei]|eukprot:EPY15139.1 hypothetical protein AGDE_17157 [Angomonas deanei]